MVVDFCWFCTGGGAMKVLRWDYGYVAVVFAASNWIFNGFVFDLWFLVVA